jgi:hypothetical protein
VTENSRTWWIRLLWIFHWFGTVELVMKFVDYETPSLRHRHINPIVNTNKNEVIDTELETEDVSYTDTDTRVVLCLPTGEHDMSLEQTRIKNSRVVSRYYTIHHFDQFITFDVFLF